MGSHCGPLTLLSITPQSSILADLVEPLDSFVRVNSMLVTNTHTHTQKRSFVKGHKTGSNYVGHENLDCFMVFLKRPSVFHQASCKRRCRNQCIPHFLSCEQRSFVVYQGASYCAEEIRSQYAQEATVLKFLQRRREMFCCTHCTLRRALHSSEPIALCPVFHDTYLCRSKNV
ncbi:Hypothetical protein, putative [Bodo saltans]|uniref:Uncharacterized protein n=1 Tax=Bodo saltans TaxID=75058 RepID=A0A0S4JGQ2_BODSA|nr:Hypothetical protein, putative [Bodo saltans]|eukprot:CUG88618.1 Hypothetical protein, putative [Bodo saltans]